MDWSTDNFNEFLNLYTRNIRPVREISRRENGIFPDIVAISSMLVDRPVGTIRGDANEDDYVNFVYRNTRPGRLFIGYTEDLSFQAIYLVFDDRVESILPETPDDQFTTETLQFDDLLDTFTFDDPLSLVVYTYREPRAELIYRYLRRP